MKKFERLASNYKKALEQILENVENNLNNMTLPNQHEVMAYRGTIKDALNGNLMEIPNLTKVMVTIEDGVLTNVHVNRKDAWVVSVDLDDQSEEPVIVRTFDHEYPKETLFADMMKRNTDSEMNETEREIFSQLSKLKF